MLGKLLGRREGGKSRKDKAIVHQSVPDEVLYPDGKPSSMADTSWLDDNPAPKPAGSAKSPLAAAKSVADSPRRVPTHAPEKKVAERVVVSLAAPNPAREGRPPFVCGWLVLVEGPGTGNWYPLEPGVSSVGGADGQTVQLAYGDDGIARAGHLSLSFDEAASTFAVAPGAGPVRVNGIETTKPARLRDGDVLSLGRTSLKLVALCSPNFRWSAMDRAAE